MSVYSLRRTQFIPAGIEQVWEFFSNPANLAEITPSYMKFRVTSPPHKGSIYPGQMITYKVSPVLGIPLTWVTEITHVADGKMFVDEQRKGPYTMWHHEHHFEEVEGGVLMTDVVYYSLPLWILGNIAHAVFVRRQLNGIFKFREQVVKKFFG